MQVFNPYSQEVLGEIELKSEEEINQIIRDSVSAKQEMGDLSAGEKSEILLHIIDGIRKKYNEFIITIAEESGKPYRYSKAEVDRAIQTFTIAAEECKRIPHELIDLDATQKGKGLKGEVIYVPKGIVFGISPFNFPLNLAVHKIAPAIATGCPIILKPSSKTPLTMELLAEIINKTNLPRGGFQLVHCSRELGNKLVEHKDIDLLSFTGSPGVGWNMKSKAGKKSVVLELGGNAAAIICDDADIDLAIEELIVGGFAYSGQVCIHTQRIYVHSSLKDDFTTKYIEKTKALKIGEPIKEDTEFGVMIDEDNAKRVEGWVKEALENGAELLLGHKREGGLYYPTILSNVKRGLKVRDEEVFGPVVIIESFDKLESAIDEVNASRWGLQASIFTDRISNRDKAFRALNVGGLIHNKSTTFRVDDMPYGGIKDSGFGREGVKYAMKDYLEAKLLVR
ncbi:MAG: aldehyde dehydrogenase [Fluviicola sp.]|nr:MAG: aldehyde dehydrogenase [Fluviicola sp.]